MVLVIVFYNCLEQNSHLSLKVLEVGRNILKPGLVKQIEGGAAGHQGFMGFGQRHF